MDQAPEPPRRGRSRFRTGRLTTAAFTAVALGTAACLAGLIVHWEIVARQEPARWQLGGVRSLHPAEARLMSKAILVLVGGGVVMCVGVGLAVFRVAKGGSRNGWRVIVFGVVAALVVGMLCLFTFT